MRFMSLLSPRMRIEESGIATPTSTALLFQRIHLRSWEMADGIDADSIGLSNA